MDIHEVIESIREKVEMMTVAAKIENRIYLEREIKEDLEELKKAIEIRK